MRPKLLNGAGVDDPSQILEAIEIRCKQPRRPGKLAPVCEGLTCALAEYA